MNRFLKLNLRPALHLLFFVTILFSAILFYSCKRKSEQILSPNTIEADSTAISALIVSCESSVIVNSGFVIIDIQQYFLNKKLITSTYNGQLFSVKSANEVYYKTILDKLIVDFQAPEPYFKNYDTFLSLVEEKFNKQSGFLKTNKLNEAQLDELFKRQGVLLPSSETFTLKNFQGLITVSARITDRASNYGILTPFFVDEPSRSTSQTKDDLVIFKSFDKSRSGGYSYSYPYPLPPSPSPIFDAPVWYWHQYTLNPYGATLIYVPPGAGLTKPTRNSNSTGQSTGDPHLTTTDNYHYDFQGYGEFIAIKSTEDNFEVQVRQEDVNNSGYVTINTAIGIQTGGDIVSITGKPFNLYVNNKLQNLNFTTLSLANNASIRKTQEKGKDVLTVITSKNDAVKVLNNGPYWIDYSLYLNDNRKGKVIGLMGNYDGNSQNDLIIRDGKNIGNSFDELYPSFADSWRIKDLSLLYYELGKNTSTYTKKDFPKKRESIDLAKWQSALDACRKAGVTNEPYLTNCATDVFYTDDLSFAQSSLWGQQNDPLADSPVGNDISYFKDVRITVSKTQGTLEDSCLINLRNGQVYQLKDGAKYASEVDGIFSYYCGIDLNTPASVITCGFSCGLSRLNSVIVGQKWPSYRTGAFELKGFVRDDNPTNPNAIPSNQWANLTSSGSISNLPWRNYIDAKSSSSGTGVILAADNTNPCVPSYFNTQTLTRFITQEGKKGVMRVKNFGKTSTGWWVTFDVKIQK